MKANMQITMLVLFVLSSLITFSSTAEIYKYKDAQGHWHFTDKPTSGDAATQKKETRAKARPEPVDLATRLRKQFRPDTPVEKATMAVVAIRTPVTHGSGFFITPRGHILTNKHVVRPTETEAWRDLKARVAEADKAYRKADRVLQRERDRLNGMEESLNEYKKAIDEADDSYAKRIAENEYNLLMNRYQEYLSSYKDVKRQYSRNKRRYEAARREFNIQSSTSVLAQYFKVILKNDEELTARLVAVSDKHDLALLQLEHYKTPYIEPADFKTLQHGTKVYAIGSPLGIKDVITSGIVAGIKQDYVITDATILPGNSGGPLLTADGNVIGINTLKVSPLTGGEGFGVAISIESALSDFRNEIRNE